MYCQHVFFQILTLMKNTCTNVTEESGILMHVHVVSKTAVGGVALSA